MNRFDILLYNLLGLNISAAGVNICRLLKCIPAFWVFAAVSCIFIIGWITHFILLLTKGEEILK